MTALKLDDVAVVQVREARGLQGGAHVLVLFSGANGNSRALSPAPSLVDDGT